MLDKNGRLIRLGDRVSIGEADEGVVVFSLDTEEFAPGYSKDEWAYLVNGIMVETRLAGLVFYDKPSEEIEVINNNTI